jgi:L,D-transpeptidase catalytic domain
MSKSSHHPHIALVIIFLMVSLLIELIVVILLQLDLLRLPLAFPSPPIKELPVDVEKPLTPFLRDEEVVVLKDNETVLPIEDVQFEYIEVINGCGVHFEGECLRVRSGPGKEYLAVFRLRNNVVLKVGGKVEHDGIIWYKIIFDEWLRYPERVEGDWYVAADYVEVLHDEGDKTIWEDGQGTTSKKIIVDKSEQKLSAYDGDELFMELPISTGLELTPTPNGTFSVYKKTPSRYMQGPLPGLIDQQVYDLPGVPWNLYFTHGGAVIHGAYWHNNFGSPYSHGCVNMPPKDARKLYYWAPLGTKVIVTD